MREITRKKAEARRFKKRISVYTIVLGTVFVASLIYLWITLDNYQKRYDAENTADELETALMQAPQSAFTDTVSSMSLSDWCDAWFESHPNHFDTENQVKAFIENNILSPGYSCYKAPSYTVNDPVYLINDGNRDLASFTMKGQALDWNVDEINFLISGTEGFSITIPEACTLYCNDNAVGKEYAADSTDADSDFNYKASLANPVNYTTYTCDGLIDVPELKLESNSEEYEICQDFAGDYYLSLSADDASNYKKKSDSFIRALLYYYTKGKENLEANYSGVLSYVPANSHAESVIRQSYDGVIWRYPENTSYQTTPSEVFVLADNCYFVDVSYTESKSEVSNETPDSNETNIYRVYWLNMGDGFKIYDFCLK